MAALTIKQMQVLQEKGLDCSKASMVYVTIKDDFCKDIFTFLLPNDNLVCGVFDLNISIIKSVPAFTLEDILRILRDHHEFHFNLRQYEIIIEDCTGEDIAKFEDESYLLMAYNALIWCLDNKLII